MTTHVPNQASEYGLHNPYVPTVDAFIRGWYQAADGTPTSSTITPGESAVRRHEYEFHRAEFLAKYGPFTDDRLAP